MTAYGYARVSTAGQSRDGTSLASQESALLAAGCDEVVSEAFTGTTTDRPALDALLGRLSKGDVLAATKLDRLARSTVEGCRLVKELLDRGVSVRILNMGTVEDTPIGRMMVAVMFAMAEFERDMIVERTQSGRAAKRMSDPGYREGARPMELDPELLKEVVALQGERKMTARQAADALGCSVATFRRRARGIRAGEKVEP